MERLHVSPTRMELTRLRKRLQTARRGHKLMKDKRDELMKRFLETVKRNRELRARMEEMASSAAGGFATAGALISDLQTDAALAYPARRVGAAYTVQNLMGVEVPAFTYKIEEGSNDAYCYGFLETAPELDSAVSYMDRLLPVMLELASVEKATQLLAGEIERTRRRVNALEYVMIPQLEETIRYIAMKMEENERSTRIRLMKVKDMVLERK